MAFYKRQASVGLLYFALLLLTCSSCNRHNAFVLHNPHGANEDWDKLIKWQTAMLADPATGKIPENIRSKELTFASTLPKQISPENKSGSFWQNRGPWNVGGRTRAVAIDVTNENTIIIGGACGGLWRSDDAGASWRKITGPQQDFAISCLVQDTRTGKTNVWYAGTGEFLGDNGGIEGDGILKSTDGGHTFTKLASTSYDAPQTNNPFDFINDIAIDESDTGNTIYVALGSSSSNGNIYKSIDGGTTWTPMYKTSIFTRNSDVAITKGGIVYFTVGVNGSAGGLFRCADGKTIVKITPVGYANYIDRMVIGIDPNDENTVYFLGFTPFSGTLDLSLWKYTYVSGNGLGIGGKWQNLSTNIPNWGGYAGQMDPQGGYNRVVKVKPGDSKTVFIGCTNLARSIDAFSTSNNVSWVGGYPVNYTLATFDIDYPNHHPDQHNLVFYPSDPNKMLSTNDGGIFRTNDNTATPIVYSSLNNGYLTTQLYGIAIDHGTPGSNSLIGGMQDNGTYTTTSSDPQTSWNHSFTGDGGYCAIVDGCKEYYLSSQLGWTFHVKLDANGYPYEYKRIDPANADDAWFIEPYVLDPNNQNRMFYLAGDYIWRNDDLTQIPLQNVNINYDTLPVKTGWDSLPSTMDTSSVYSALAMAHSPSQRLVFGTNDGHLYKMDSAYAINPTVVDITPKGGFQKSVAYVNCIAINPVNADQMIVVFSNYSVKSLFATEDGGNTWKDISANLEQFPDGTGNGPSCRWASILPLGYRFAYFIGTSTGLYSTDTLKGDSTVWTQQSPDEIGNDIVSMIDTRVSDGYVAIGTYGNGFYTANITYPYQISGVDQSGESILTNQNLNCYPDPVASTGILNLDYANRSFCGNTASVTILNEEGKTISSFDNVSITGVGIRTIPITLPELKPGIYYIRLQKEDDLETKTFIVR